MSPPDGQQAVASWRFSVACWALVSLALVMGMLQPPFDPDLPLHLSIGRFIVASGHVPLLDPFAWTRAADWYYAYSWLPDLLYYWTWCAGGLHSLAVLSGFFSASAVLAALLAARGMGIERPVAVGLAFSHWIVATQISAFLRPQWGLFTFLPLSYWLASRHVTGRGRLLPPLLLAILAANWHIWALLILIPWFLALARPRSLRGGVVASVVASGMALLATPYLFYPGAIRTVFEPSRMLGSQSKIVELQSLYHSAAHRGVLVGIALWQVWVLWLYVRANRDNIFRADILAQLVLWLVGCVSGLIAVRLIGVWWLVTWQMQWLGVAAVLRAAPSLRPWSFTTSLSYGLASAAFVFALFASWNTEMTVDNGPGVLPTAGSEQVDRLVDWLKVSGAPKGGRMYNPFSQGSYLVWALKDAGSWKTSMYNGTQFPRDVVDAEMGGPGFDGGTIWKRADAAILPSDRAEAAAMAKDTAWRLVAASPVRRAPVLFELWVRRAWWVGPVRAVCLPVGSSCLPARM